jgi:small-conductance mechanosensitive channel
MATDKAPALDPELLGPLLVRLIGDLSAPHGWWSVAVLAACLGVAWAVGRRVEARIAARQERPLTIKWVRRVAWPVVGLVLLWIAGAALDRFIPVTLLEVAVALLFAMVIVRTAALVLRQTFSSSPWVVNSERAIATVAWVLLALHLLGLLPLVEEALESVSLPLGRSRLTLLQLITGLITVAVATTLAMWASKALDARLASARGVDQGARAVIGRIAQPVLILLALIVALPMVGIDLTTLSVLGGAFGVGLGLGLQRIAASYVSGFIILLDHSIEPGRLVRVDKYRGIVGEIRTRYTVLKGLDGVEAIVPNDLFVTSVVESETFSSTTSRVAVRVGVAYASDVERAMQILAETAAAQPRVLAAPPPAAFLAEFADSAILLECGFWIGDPEQGTLALRSDIHRELLRRFRAEGIEIPFAQREVTVKGSVHVSSAAPSQATASSQPQPQPQP